MRVNWLTVDPCSPPSIRSKYAYELCVTNALGGVSLPCNFDAALASGGGPAALTASPQLIGLLASCPVKGDDLLANMGLYKKDMWTDVGILIGMATFYLVCTFLALARLKKN